MDLMQAGPSDNSILVCTAISFKRHHKVLNLALPSNYSWPRLLVQRYHGTNLPPHPALGANYY